MKSFTFYIEKAIRWHPRVKWKKKTLTVKTEDLVQARKYVYANYPSYEISMFWPKD